MLFSRRRGSGRHAKAEELAGSVAAKTDDRRARRAALLEELELSEPDGAEEAAPAQPTTPGGPFDFGDLPPGGLAGRVDLGSLLVPAIDGVEIRMQAQDSGVIQQLVLVNGDNALQLGAFAAPRTDGLWDEWRAEIRKSLFNDGVASDEVPGRWGTELRARLRTQEGFKDLRFVGIDGPRWMVYGVWQGLAAADPALAGPLDDCLTGLVVRRDETARPTREVLPLRLPEQMRPEGSDDEASPEAAEQPGPAERPRRKPSPRPRRD